MQELSYLNRYFSRYKLSITIGVLFVALSNIFGILSAQVIRYCVDLIKEYIDLYYLFQSSSIAKPIIVKIISTSLFAFALLYFSFQLLKGTFMFFMRQTIIVTSRKIEYDIKHDIFKHFQSLPLSFFKENTTGDLMTRITEDVTRVRMYLGPAIMYTINIITLFIITISIMLYVNIELSFYSLIPLPFLSLLIYKVSTVMYKKGEKIQETLSSLTTISQEVFSGIRVIKSFTRLHKFQSLFEKESLVYRSRNIDLAKIESLFFPLVILLIGMSTILTIYIGGKQVINGEITYGNIVEFVYYINLLTWPVTAIGWIASLVQRAKVSQRRINEFLKTPKQDLNLNGLTSSIIGDINFQKVSFTYPETGIEALKDVSFSVKKGSKLAIVGKTGSGKSTIAQLLLNFYSPNTGSIEINNYTLEEYNIKSYRDQIGYVSQDVFLFSDSIENNIAFGRKGKTDIKTIEKYADLVSLTAELNRMPKGLQTKIGERGISLSGGQKQRISIARALSKEPNLLILDDCLSAVDANTENEIFNNLSDSNKLTTSIIITHRVLSLNKVDQILFLESGKVKELGTFDELMVKKGAFYSLYQKQILEEKQS